MVSVAKKNEYIPSHALRWLLRPLYARLRLFHLCHILELCEFAFVWCGCVKSGSPFSAATSQQLFESARPD